MTEKSSRFNRVAKDPRFRRPARKDTKIKVDDRFKGIFTDTKFTRPYTVDKYGRKLDTKKTARKEMEKFYKLDEDKDEEVIDSEGIDTDASIEDDFSGESSSSSDSGSGSDSDSDSDSISEDDESSHVFDDAFSQHPLVSNSEVQLGDATCRLAIVNVDWDQLKAVDLYVLVNAFKPPMGQVKAVKIFPSEFGKERIEKEAAEGPPKAIFASAADDATNNGKEEEEDEDDDGFVGYAESTDEDCDPLEDLKKAKTLVEESGNFDQAALRRYQLERLRYYYAVVECDSIETAAAIYHHCDGREFETSTNCIDMRYIPDDVTFEADEMTDCAMSIPKKYNAKPGLVTDALQRSSVKLTWDQDDPDRRRLTRCSGNNGKIDYEEADLRAYLASDSEDDDESSRKLDPKEDRIARYRALLLSTDNNTDENENNNNVFGRKSHADNEGLDITFTSALCEEEEEETERVAVFDADGNLVSSLDDSTGTDQKRSKKSSSKKPENEKFILQKEWSKKGSTVKKMHKKQSDLVEDSFKLDLEDDRFGAVYDSPAFAIDPTAPMFKKTKGMDAIIQERQKRRRQGDSNQDELRTKKRKN